MDEGFGNLQSMVWGGEGRDAALIKDLLTGKREFRREGNPTGKSGDLVT